MRRTEIEGIPVCIAGGTDREGGGNGPLVILLHGYGASGEDLVPLYRQLQVPSEVRFAFPAAPLDLGEELGRAYAGGRAWWMIDLAAFEASARGEPRADRSAAVPDGLPAARHLVARVVAALQEELGATPKTTVLGGFSQGAMLSLDVALRSAEKPAALVLMSGSITAGAEWAPLFPSLAGTPVLQSHGRSDPILPYATAEKLKGLLEAAGAKVRFVEFAGGHTITSGVLTGLNDLVLQVLPGQRD
jgi:phospholipase/carboxylesterase